MYKIFLRGKYFVREGQLPVIHNALYNSFHICINLRCQKAFIPPICSLISFYLLTFVFEFFTLSIYISPINWKCVKQCPENRNSFYLLLNETIFTKQMATYAKTNTQIHHRTHLRTKHTVQCAVKNVVIKGLKGQMEYGDTPRDRHLQGLGQEKNLGYDL